MDKIIKKYIENCDLDDLAKYILFNTHLNINGEYYRMIEIEIYVCNDYHNDITTHCHNEQLKMLTWYFHQLSSKEHSYKGGSYKGIDITCGWNDSSKSFGGILIRTIMNEKTGQAISGPCLSVNKILELSNYSNIKDLIITGMNSNLSCLENPLLKLELTNFQSTDMYHSTRIGLKPKGEYFDKKYRYIIFGNKVKKEVRKRILM